MNEIISVSNVVLNHITNNNVREDSDYCHLSYTKGKRLLRKTLANHLLPEYWHLITEKGYYYCEDTDCPVIYFNNETDKYLGIKELRTSVMHKQTIGSENRIACYCKNVLEKTIVEELLNNDNCNTLDDVKVLTEANTGKDCSITNPTGRCCGSQIKGIIEWTQRLNTNVEVPSDEDIKSCCEELKHSTE